MEDSSQSIKKVTDKTITGDKKMSFHEYFFNQLNNPGLPFLLSIVALIVIILGIPTVIKTVQAIEVNEARKAKFEKKLMPRALAIPVNMLPYVRFQQMALLNGKYSNWQEPVFRTGSCSSENLQSMPEGIYKRAIVTGCFQFDQLQNQYKNECQIDNCILTEDIIVRIRYIMNQVESPFWDKGFVEPRETRESDCLNMYDGDC